MIIIDVFDLFPIGLLLAFSVVLFLGFCFVTRLLGRTLWNHCQRSPFGEVFTKCMEEKDVAGFQACELCGSPNDLIFTAVEDKQVIRCAGCSLYATICKSLLPQGVLLLLTITTMPIASDSGFPAYRVFIELCILYQLVLLVILWKRPYFTKYATELDRTEENKVVVHEDLPEDSLVNKAVEDHRESLQSELIEGEKLLWVESVSRCTQLPHNATLMKYSVMIFSIAAISTSMAFLIMSSSLWSVICTLLFFPGAATFLLWKAFSKYLETNETYAITNLRLVRLQRMGRLGMLKVSSVPVNNVTHLITKKYGESTQGNVAWSKPEDSFSFSKFESVSNIDEVVGVLTGLKGSPIADDQEHPIKDKVAKAPETSSRQYTICKVVWGVLTVSFVITFVACKSFKAWAFPMSIMLWAIALACVRLYRLKSEIKCERSAIVFQSDE
eukprot:TRINITY_DN11041_c0_g1_i1.p1 TRINITY_DN11041_c0_g1~~TRINITY_DN11041_c0_g1_i1.p1  ORF type:complete len:450 (-),score=142.48 TRINITY_DN11041_c0_g1_i1:69-1394(-)